MSSTNTLAPFQATLKDGRPRCRCRVWGGGTGPQCGNPAKNDGICGTHWCVVERGSLPIAGFYDKPRPRIWGEELNGNFHQVPEGAKAGDTIPWKSNATEPREDTPEPGDSGDTSLTDMDHIANAAYLAPSQERLHELGVPRMSADEAWAEAENEFADAIVEMDDNPLTEIPQVSVTCIDPNARIKCNAPDGSKYRREYTFSIGGAEAKRDCWHWWRDPMDGIIRILGGNPMTKKPTIYRVEVKGNSHLSFKKKDEDQSKAMELYNKYGRK